MTTELEQEFYNTFGIEKVKNFNYCNGGIVEYYLKYPDITAEKLLEMICICNSTYINGYTNYFMTTGKTKEELKEEVLKKCIALSKDINQQIQQLFKEEE